MSHRPLGVPARGARVALLLLTLAAAAPVASGCARKGGARTEEPLTGPTTIQIRNQAFLDMNIYAVRSSQRIRLGTVTGNSTQVLRIPPYLIAGATPLRFIADPIGGNRSPVSEEIVVNPGDQVVLTIPPR